MTLAEKIANLRKQRGWSQEDLAEYLGISRQSVSKWESEGSMPELDKIVKMSSLFSVSTDYLLKEDREEEVYAPNLDNEIIRESSDSGVKETVRKVSEEEAESFIRVSREVSGKIALGVVCCILSPVCLFILMAVLEYEKTFLQKETISEDMAAGIGIIVILLFVAVGVAFLIYYGSRLSKWEFLEKEAIVLPEDMVRRIRDRKDAYSAGFRRNVTIGVVLCILGAVPVLLAAAVEEEFLLMLSVGVVLIMVAAGVFLFVKSGTVQGSFDKLLQEGDFTLENKAVNRKFSSLPGIYWCIVTAIYLGYNFWSGNWSKSWIIWPVTGVLFAAVLGIAKASMKKSNKNEGCAV